MGVILAARGPLADSRENHFLPCFTHGTEKWISCVIFDGFHAIENGDTSLLADLAGGVLPLENRSIAIGGKFSDDKSRSYFRR
uniref:Uncharacterized protein n=1 Tax=Candidatus Kentrum sp. LFY TaxID=2126342 RepID=A0A450URR2_9GAMM|nr:MAG: hypothetical protein BECKLFY1418A_GA0070994_104818 [Candidatus Kentron sp. LFY]